MEWLYSRAIHTEDGVLLAVVLFGTALLLALLARASLRRALRITPPEVQEKLDAGLEMLVLDTRPPAVFALGHIASAINVPLPELRRELSESCSVLPANDGQLVVVVAESGPCVQRCVDRLRHAGYTRVCVVEGGMQGWCADRLPLSQAVEAVATLQR